MNGEMYHDAELLDDILNAAPVSRCGRIITAKLLAHWTGYSVKTISDYRRGKLTIPSRFWRTIFTHHRDGRIMDLVTGDTPCRVVFEDSLPDLAGGGPALKAAIDAVGDFHNRHKYLAEILRDGRIDETDDKAIGEYNAAFFAGWFQEAAIHRAINRAHQAATAERAAS